MRLFVRTATLNSFLPDNVGVGERFLQRSHSLSLAPVRVGFYAFRPVCVVGKTMIYDACT